MFIWWSGERQVNIRWITGEVWIFIELSDGGAEGGVTEDIPLNGEAGGGGVIWTEASDLYNLWSHLVLMLNALLLRLFRCVLDNVIHTWWTTLCSSSHLGHLPDTQWLCWPMSPRDGLRLLFLWRLYVDCWGVQIQRTFACLCWLQVWLDLLLL